MLSCSKCLVFLNPGIEFWKRCNMAFIEPMHCNKHNVTYLLWISKVKYISPTRRSKNLPSCHEMKNWTLGLKCGLDLDLEFSRSKYLMCNISGRKWSSCHEKWMYQLNARPQMWLSVLTLTMTLSVNFQGWMFNISFLIYLWEKKNWLQWNKNENELMSSTPGLKCGHHFLLWPWTDLKFF